LLLRDPATAAKVTRRSTVVSFESCDPGADPDATDVHFNETALALPVIRNQIGIGLVRSGAPSDVARRVAGKITDAYSVEELTTGDPAKFETNCILRPGAGIRRGVPSRVTRGQRRRLVGSDGSRGWRRPFSHAPIASFRRSG
jgi:hypothetical protein